MIQLRIPFQVKGPGAEYVVLKHVKPWLSALKVLLEGDIPLF